MQSAPAKILITPPLSTVEDVSIGAAVSFSAGRKIRPFEGRSVIRHPDRLKLHPALEKIGWTGLVDELNDAARVKDQALRDHVFITENGTILAGFGRWQLALLEHRDEIPCIEYSFDENESLQFTLAHHRPLHAWNAFVRIRLALTLAPYFQERALENMRTGGKYKGSAKLPEAEAIDVREQIAAIAGVGARNVSNVQLILARAHPRITDALRDSRLTINRAIQLCKLPYFKQSEEFIRSTEERERKKVIHKAVSERTSLEVLALLRDLQQRETQHPGSVVVRIGPDPARVIFMMKDSTTALTGKRS